MSLIRVVLGLDEPDGRVTIARRHASFGMARRARAASVVHRPALVAVEWPRRSGRVVLGARWLCHSYSGDAALLDDPDSVPFPQCSACAAIARAAERGAVPGQACVYYAERGGLIKIGTSINVGQRVANLRADLLTFEPVAHELSAVVEEHRRHAQFADFRVEGEWFRPEGRLLRHISMVREAEQAAAEAVA